MQERWSQELAAQARAYWTPERTAALAHGKDLAILPGEAPQLLRALGLLHRDASMPPPEVRKFLQINHLVKLLAPALATLHARHGVVRLLDAGCGRSYLTLLLAWCARARWGFRVEVLGVDRNADVIAECRRRAAIAELDDLVRFEAEAVADVVLTEPVHGVFALHACDTATCDAIALGVRLGADLIAVAPCCQAELARGWARVAEAGASGPFAPIWETPHLRREVAAHVTDAMRMLLLRAAGYDALPMEFIAMEHTKKNTLIKALRQGAPDAAARDAYEALVAATGGQGLALAVEMERSSPG